LQIFFGFVSAKKNSKLDHIWQNYHEYSKSSAIAEMALVFLVNSDHGHSQKLILDANLVYFYGSTTLWYSSLKLNPVVGCYGTQP